MITRCRLPHEFNSAGRETDKWLRSTSARWWLALIVLSMTMVSGCGGCTDDGLTEAEKAAAKEKLKKEKEKPKPDFERPRLSIVPQKTDVAAIRLVKPGHWTAAVEEAKANNFDFVGQLYAEVRDKGSGKVLDLERTPHKLAIIRPAPLPKGQTKFLEMMFLVPGNAPSAWLATEIRSRGGSPVFSPGPEPLSLQKAHQYNMVVLSVEGDRYRRLESMDCVRAPNLDGPLNYYQVVTPQIVKPLPLPSNSMAWTNIAYIVWDDADPQMLSLEQQKAMVDWLHWGGQIIISGPKSLDQLRGTAFLGPYLPAVVGKPMEITTATLAPLSKYWTLKERGQPARPLAPVNPWSGVSLDLQGDAKFVPNTADLVAERKVGRGRIVATSFRLTQREFWNWPGCDGFWNGCLLHRPPRQFSSPGNSSLSPLRVDFTERSLNDWSQLLPGAIQEYLGKPLANGQCLDPCLVTQVRYLTRDWKKDEGFNPTFKAPPSYDEATLQQPYYNRMAPLQGLKPDETDDGSVSFGDGAPLGPGMAGWSDFTDVANGARDSLVEAAGIVIPKAGFVIWVLVLYLVVLVPLNWLVFWALGRVEWAWIAAPIIAIGGMAAVVKLAQLDIGFARAQTEVAVLEAYNGYPRGHLTRYTALYTSLSTSYDLTSEDPNTISLPFCATPEAKNQDTQSSSTVTYQSDPSVKLSDFAVSSNFTAMLHTEQMLDLGGAFQYSANGDNADFDNKTNFNLKRAGIVRRTPKGELQIGWIGELPSGRGTKLNFVRLDAHKSLRPEWSFSMTDKAQVGPQFTIDRLANLLKPPELVTIPPVVEEKETAEGNPDEANQERPKKAVVSEEDAKKLEAAAKKASAAILRPGETRLIALIDEPLPGIEVDPAASQRGRGATMVISHLESPPLAAPRPDANCRRDIITGREERELPDYEPIVEPEEPDA
jgi:hypothetical protein